jgi:hypothetical protein
VRAAARPPGGRLASRPAARQGVANASKHPPSHAPHATEAPRPTTATQQPPPRARGSRLNELLHCLLLACLRGGAHGLCLYVLLHCLLLAYLRGGAHGGLPV